MSAAESKNAGSRQVHGPGRPMTAAEKGWWLGLGLWLVVFAFWRPEPPPIYTQVPSVKKDPDGYRIFYEMVAKQGKSVSRSLRSPKHLKNKDVLVLLRPSKGLDQQSREALMKWVSESGGTLVVGYPLWSPDGTLLESPFLKEAHWNLSLWKEREAQLQEVTYSPVNVDAPREVAPFTMKLRGEMALGAGSSTALAYGDAKQVLASWDAYGAGQIIQLSDAALLSNESLGFKKSHIFAAALLDEIGRDKHWVFDESNEGVSIQPALAPLLGSGRFRAVFLQLLLFFLFWYWYKTRRLTRIHTPVMERDVREVTTLAADIGRFYFGARKSSWALSRYLEFFKRRIQLANMSPAERNSALQTASLARQVLDGQESAEIQLNMIRKMAEHRQVFRKKQRDEE
ncbi:MAG: DUF4350 domain-containing protein [Deltaproteobacteria bacterium]|nr:DUF4350 domain-containing protein [Deltaproteobacteria bacterium]